MDFFPEDTISINYVSEAYLSMTEYMLEFQVMLDEEYSLLTEAGDDKQVKMKTKSLVKRRSLLGLLRDFIKKVVNLFQNSSHKFYKLYNFWLKKAKENLDTVNFNNLKVTIYGSYFQAQNKLDAAKTMAVRIDSYNFDKIRCNSMDEFLEKPEFKKYTDKSGSLASGCKNFFRYGNTDPILKKVTLTGDNLKMAVSQAINYCLTYAETVKTLKAISASFEATMKSAESVANKNEQQTQESLCLSLLEGYALDFEKLSIYDRLSENYLDILLEEEQNQQQNQQNNQPKQEPKNTAPKVETDTNEKPGEQKQEPDKRVEDLSAADAKTLTFLCKYVQIAYSSALTVAEERYNTYIKICKYALSKSKFKYSEELSTGDDVISKSKADKKTKVDNSNILKRTAHNITDKVKNVINQNK